MNLIPKKSTNSGFWLDPYKELDRLHNEMNSLFNWSVGASRDPDKEGNYLTYSVSPSMDYDEDENNVLIKADMPGIDKKNIDVSIQDGVLTIRGERKEEKKRRENGAHLTERHSGTFFRQFSLPTAVDESKIAAEYKDGVLHLTLPKKEEAKPKQIKVDVK